MNCLIGVDIGTSGTKTVLMEESGKILATATQEYPLDAPHPGWSEQNPEDWWAATCSTINKVLAESDIDAADVKGIGYSGQMHGSVFLDGKGQVVRPCILWNDGRTVAECAEILDRVGADKMHEWVSNPPMAGFTAPKVLWLRNHEPDNFKRTRHLLLPKDYVRYRMTGQFATDVTDAAGTVLYHVRERRWATELLEALELPAEIMPDVYPSYEVTGELTNEAASACGLKPGTPVVGGGADNPCGAVGSGVVTEGRVMVSLGTSGVIFCPSSEPRVDAQERLHSFNAAPEDQWYLMGVVLSAGMCLRWYRDRFGASLCAEAEKQGRDPYELMMDSAAEAPIGAEDLLFLPYLMGERCPVNDPAARGAFVGLGYRHGESHLLRAIVEGVTMALRDNMEVVRSLGVPVEQVRVTGGGARSSFWRQILADALGCEIVTLGGGEGPGQGAAILAGKGVGLYDDLVAATDAMLPVAERTSPNPDGVAAYNDMYARYSRMYPALREFFHEG